MTEQTDPTEGGLPQPDAHLRAALRQAPDRDLQPPPALSALILGKARRAVAPPPWRQRFWAWLARPAPAGAFASLLLAGFVGLMWRDGPPSRGLTPPPVAQVPRASLADRQQALRSDAATAKESITSSPLTATPVLEPPSSHTQANARGGRYAPNAIAAAAPAADRSQSGEQAEPAELAKPAEPAMATTAERAAASDAAAPQRALPTVRRVIPAMPAPLARNEAAAGSMDGSALSTPGQAGTRPQEPTDPLAAPLAAWRSDRPEDAVTHNWWEALRAQTVGRWRRAEAVESTDTVMLLGPGGEPLGWLLWEPAAVRWQWAGDGQAWRAELTATDVERLRAAMPR